VLESFGLYKKIIGIAEIQKETINEEKKIIVQDII